MCAMFGLLLLLAVMQCVAVFTLAGKVFSVLLSSPAYSAEQVRTALSIKNLHGVMLFASS